VTAVENGDIHQDEEKQALPSFGSEAAEAVRGKPQILRVKIRGANGALYTFSMILPDIDS
jgi:hypothetical protein